MERLSENDSYAGTNLSELPPATELVGPITANDSWIIMSYTIGSKHLQQTLALNYFGTVVGY
jgi:hypothetical protein